MASYNVTAGLIAADLAPTLGMAGAVRAQVQNVDSRDVLFLFESRTVPPAGTLGHRIAPGQWYDCSLNPNNRLFGWSERTCNVVITETFL